MISEPGLGALRVAATLTHCLPALRLRLRAPSGSTLLEVGPGLLPGEPRHGGGTGGSVAGSVVSMSPCAFRHQVVRAHQRVEGGERVGFLSLDGDPAIEIGVPASGRTFAGGIHRVAIGDTWIYAFGVTGPQDLYATAGRPVVDRWTGPVPDRLGLRPDLELGTVVCYAETTPAERRGAGSPGFGDEDAIVDLLGELLAVFTAEAICGSSSSVSRRVG